MLILVTGWRKHPDWSPVWGVLDGVHRLAAPDEMVVLLHGNYGNADKYASQWTRYRHVGELPFPPERYGSWPGCGPRRNQAMIDWLVGVADKSKYVLAFPQPDWETAKVCGTRHCIKRARIAGFEPQIYPAESW